MIPSPDVTFILVKLVNFPEEEEERMKLHFEYVVYENGYLMYEIVDNTIDTFKLSFCKIYSIKVENVKLVFRGEVIDTKETKSKTLKEMGITNEIFCEWNENKDIMFCEWNRNDKKM
jgi:hypothetical protein